VTRLLQIPTGWNGPARSANGGVAAGTVAALFDGPVDGPLDEPAARTVRVRLHAPPPLGTDLTAERDGDTVEVHAPDGTHLLTARPTAPQQVAIPDVDGDEVGWGSPFPDHPAAACVVCGPTRDDGLGVLPAPVPDRPDGVATWWTPPAWALRDGLLRDELLWGVLDCPGALAVMHASDEPVFAALGEVTGELRAPVHAGQRVLVVGALLSGEGRKRHAATAVLDADGEVLAHTTQLCLAVDPSWAG
jgi:hypothetical protein